jgi:NADH-quinone oxidoreductase subunit E/NADP-reducing hydrogenase subunit HndA
VFSFDFEQNKSGSFKCLNSHGEVGADMNNGRVNGLSFGSVFFYNKNVLLRICRKELFMAKLSTSAVAKILEICDRYTDEKTPLMMILSDIQNEYGYIPLEVQELVSARTGISVAEIYGVVTFYSFFSLTPKGKYIVGCCLGTACYVKGAQQIIDKFSEVLGIKPGETSEDGLFTLDALRCIGACGIAPAVSINGQVHPKMTVDQVKKIVDDLRAEGGAA